MGDDYASKMKLMLECLGDLTLPQCSKYRRQADGLWRQMAHEEYWQIMKNKTIASHLNHLEGNYRCCCNLQETGGELTMDSACAWLRQTTQTNWRGHCPTPLKHKSLSEGG